MRNLAAGANFLCIPFENRSDDGLAEASGARVLVGDNQRYKPNTLKFLEVAGDPALGALTGLSSHMLDSWDGILKAHFWMASEKDSYLLLRLVRSL
jgi:predicted dehydrogenase